MAIILWNTFKSHRWATLAVAVLLLGFGLIAPASYDSFGPQASPDFWERMPKGLSAFIKAEGSLLVASGAEGYIAISLRHPIVLIALAAFAIATASGGLAREIERGTILILLARPLKRYDLVLGKGIESFVGLVLLVVALMVGTFAGVQMAGIGDEVGVGYQVVIGFNALCLGLSILGYAYLFSATGSDGGRTTLLATGVTVGFFFLDFMANLFDVLEPLGFLSIFQYYDPVAVAIDGSFPLLDVGVLLATGAAAYGVALVVFQRRDIAA